MAERISLEKLYTVFYYAVGTLKFHTDVRCSTLRCYYLAALVTSFMDYGNSFPGHHANISPWSNSPACHCERSFQQALWKCHLPVKEAMDPPSSAWQSRLSHWKHQPPNTALLTASLQLQSLLLSRGPALLPSACAWPPHSAAPSLKMPLYPVALALLPSSGLCSAHVHPYLQAWPLHSSSGLVTGFNKLL